MNEIQTIVRDIAEEVATKPIEEGRLTKKIENQTAKLPSVVFLNLALCSVAITVGLAASRRTRPFSSLVGHLAPSFLILGLYNKLVKLDGNDRYNH